LSDTEQNEPQTGVSLRSVSLVTFFSVGQLFVLFALQLVLAKLFGAAPELDVYVAVLAIPLVVSAMLSGSLGAVLIPLANELKAAHEIEVVDAILRRFGWLLLLVSSLLAVGIFFASEQLVRFLFGEFSEPQILLGVEMLRILAWLVPLNTMTTFMFAIYHSRSQFLLPAMSGLVGPSLTVAIIIFWPETDVVSIAWAVLIGGIVGVAFLLRGFPSNRTDQPLPFRQPFMRFSLLLSPLILGAVYGQLDPLVDRHLAAGLSEGSISHLGYAWRLISSVAVLATSGLAVVAFPAMARHAASKNDKLFVSELAHSWRFLCVVVVPCVGGIFLFSDTLVAWLMERGEFTASNTAAVAQILRLYLGVALGAGVGEVANRALCARGLTYISPIIGATCVTFAWVAKFMLAERFQAEGLALISSVGFIVGACLHLAALRWHIRGKMFEGIIGVSLRTLVASTCALGIAWPVLHGAQGWRVLLGVILSVVIYVVAQWIMRDEFVLRLWEGARKQIGGEKKRQ